MAALLLTVVFPTLFSLNAAHHNPLCNTADVTRTCAKLNGGQQSIDVSKAQLMLALSANQSSIDSMWEALGLEAAGDRVGCEALCQALVEYINKVGVAPPNTNSACCTVNGKTTCNVDVSPERLHSMMTDMKSNINEFRPDDGPMVYEFLTELDEEVRTIPPRLRGVWDYVEVTANFFYIYPSSGADLNLNTEVEPTAEAALQAIPADQYIAAQNAEVVDAQVRDRIQRSMNFVSSQLPTMRFVYPANSARDNVCSTAGAIAYVWRNPARGSNYRVTTGPVCSNNVDPFRSKCALDRSGRYFVYLCTAWPGTTQVFQVATIIHEAIHHTGPDDITYDTTQMRYQSQTQQLDNAANYENFAMDVADAGTQRAMAYEQIVEQPAGEPESSLQIMQAMRDNPLRTMLVVTMAMAAAAAVYIILASLGTCAMLDRTSNNANRSWVLVEGGRQGTRAPAMHMSSKREAGLLAAV
eukprot:CAMPEP_0179127058 /NCGR_PEP_ID=MMETSP0796-20121207/60173_1 /TAXON_ID=73915 /ORGANISM="Pyrodinium bahamense, Strain pbaha01" /LENGTH=468 /DNA_ID=CAMNT_0020825835 /DNA_START=41 /DNA_END=1448 /DNA_ORIENTATION=+